MKILFLGDIVGNSGCLAVKKNLPEQIKNKNIDFVIVNGENAADQGVGITEEICKDLFNSGVDVITSGNHVWDQKEIIKYIDKENRLLRPENLTEVSFGKGFEVFTSKNGFKIGVLNLMGNIFMKKCDDVFEASQKFIKKNSLKKDYDFLVIDTHTHVPTNDARILKNGSAYQTDAGMSGDYNSVIGMDKNNSLNKFLKKESKKHFPATGIASLCGVIVEASEETGLANNIEYFVHGGVLKHSD